VTLVGQAKHQQRMRQALTWEAPMRGWGSVPRPLLEAGSALAALLVLGQV